MSPNEIIRRLQFMLDVDIDVITQCFSLANCLVSSDEAKAMLIPEDREGYLPCSQEKLSYFLDGLIVFRRGDNSKQEGAKAKGQRNTVALNNNVILKKIRIALELQARDLDNAFMLADHEISPHEISALFRKPGTKHYVECSDEVFERLLSGLSLYFRS